MYYVYMHVRKYILSLLYKKQCTVLKSIRLISMRAIQPIIPTYVSYHIRIYLQYNIVVAAQKYY